MTTVVILQSNYIPWKGYFDLIRDADLFIFYDDVQYTVRDWRNRNRIQTPQGPQWLSIPVGADRNRRICDVTLNDPGWQALHWKSLKQNYGKRPYFNDYQGFFEEVYLGRTWTRLSALNQHLIQRIATDLLGLSTRFADSASFAAVGAKQDRILSLLTQAGASRYISGPAARSYLDEATLEQAGIALNWKDYLGYPVYDQGQQPFEHGVSILDLLFNVGPQAPWYIWGWRAGGRP